MKTEILPAQLCMYNLQSQRGFDQIAPTVDHAVSALIEDLVKCDRLSETLVANLTEFGRSPRLNRSAGRDHWPECWTSWFAGGGFGGGQVIGKSDVMGAEPVDRPVTPKELAATVYALCGIALSERIRGPDGESRPIVDADTQPIAELTSTQPNESQRKADALWTDNCANCSMPSSMP
jgi:hypothetical protein